MLAAMYNSKCVVRELSGLNIEPTFELYHCARARELGIFSEIRSAAMLFYLATDWSIVSLTRDL